MAKAKDNAQAYMQTIKAMSDDELKQEAQKLLSNDMQEKLDMVVDECESRNKGYIMEEVYVWYSLST